MTTLHDAVRSGSIEAVRARLAAGDGVNARDVHGATPLHYATDLAIVNALLDASADGDALDAEGKAPVYWNAAHAPVVERLLRAGARADRLATVGASTPLHRAAEAEAPDSVRAMLAAGVAVETVTVGGYCPGRTALHSAASTGATEAARALLDAGADPNRADDGREGFDREGGTTPVHCAAEEGHDETLQLLLERGGDPYLEDNDGRTAERLAEREGHDAVLAVIARYANGEFDAK